MKGLTHIESITSKVMGSMPWAKILLHLALSVQLIFLLIFTVWMDEFYGAALTYNFAWVLTTVLLIALSIIGRVVMERKLKKSEDRLLKGIDEISVSSKSQSTDTVLTSNSHWNLGLACIKGNVRVENQDYGICFEIRGFQVLIAADGLGGLPYGKQAARLAVHEATISLIRSLSTAKFPPDLGELVTEAIAHASQGLAREGEALNIADIREGLRTTLIILIGGKTEFAYAYIGDGGGVVLQTSGHAIDFMVPQKADGEAMNVLAASLGPVMEGEPVIGKLPRHAGDFIIIGTDGIFDRVDSTSFPKDLLKAAIDHKGDLQKVTNLALHELAEFQDSAGYVCDDNMTLGLMGDKKAPKLSPDFWTATASGKEE